MKYQMKKFIKMKQEEILIIFYHKKEKSQLKLLKIIYLKVQDGKVNQVKIKI